MHALEGVVPVLWPRCTEEDKETLLAPLLGCAAADPSAACRAAAQHALQTLSVPLPALCRPLWQLHRSVEALLGAADADVAGAALAAAAAPAAAASKRRRTSTGSRKSVESSDNDGASAAAAAASEAERCHIEGSELLRVATRRGQAKKTAFVGFLGVEAGAAATGAEVRRAAHALRDVKAAVAQHGDGGNMAGIAEEARRILWEAALEAVVPVLEMLQWCEVRVVAEAAQGSGRAADGSAAAEECGAAGGDAEMADAGAIAGKRGAAAEAAAVAVGPQEALQLSEVELQDLLAGVQVCA